MKMPLLVDDAKRFPMQSGTARLILHRSFEATRCSSHSAVDFDRLQQLR